MAQQLDLDGNQTDDRVGGRSPGVPGSVPHAMAVNNPVQPTQLSTGERCRFSGSADAPTGTKRVTIALRGATSYHLSFPYRARPDAVVAWDVTLAIQPGISEVTVSTEDHAGNRTTLRRLLIARTLAAPSGQLPLHGLQR